MSMYFTKDDDLILFHFSMKKLNMFNFLHIKMMKISFEITRHLCFVFATTRNLHTFVCFYVQKQSSRGVLPKSVLRNFAKFTGKHLCQTLFLNKELWHRCFPVNFAKFLKSSFLHNTSGWLFLKISAVLWKWIMEKEKPRDLFWCQDAKLVSAKICELTDIKILS